MLRENIPCRAVLALTATATKATEASMVQALRISPSAVFRDASLRDNLRFHVHHTNGGTHLLLSARLAACAMITSMCTTNNGGGLSVMLKKMAAS
jgi:superfamily II DNA helicase RecQ